MPPAGSSLPQASSTSRASWSTCAIPNPEVGTPHPRPQSHVSSTENSRVADKHIWVPLALAGSLIPAGTHFGVGQLTAGWLLGSQLLGDVPEQGCCQLPAVTGQEGPQQAVNLTCGGERQGCGRDTCLSPQDKLASWVSRTGDPEQVRGSATMTKV